MKSIQRLKNWTMRLPNVWGLGHAQIHSSLFIMLSILSLMILLLSLSRSSNAEYMSISVILPVVWLLSLAVRSAAQQLVLGEDTIELDTTIGPSGNLSTDYEYLPSSRILLYSIAGQLATFGLAMLGFVVKAAMSQHSHVDLEFVNVLAFRGGWSSEAWAWQIMWVNVFLGVLHLLPTVPFDMRATMFAMFSFRDRNAQEPHVFRRIAYLDTHLATFMLGAGAAALILSWSIQREVVGWYAAIAAAVYLFVAGQWENSRADESEEQYSPISPLRSQRSKDNEAVYNNIEAAAAAARREELDKHETDASAELLDVAEGSLREFVDDGRQQVSDIDEILRKLHREGSQSLLPHEQQALLSASRELKEKRGQAS